MRKDSEIHDLEAKLAKAVEAVTACAHIGVDCGYGEYTVEWAVDFARKTLEEIEKGE